MAEKKIRLLNADEIEARIQSVNKGGVVLLLYKDARVDQNILDETFGPLNWQRHHTRDNANCIVAVWDDEKKQWIEKEDTGTESYTEKEKGLASDSFKRACVNLGIGRELYTAPDIFIPKDKLTQYKEGDKPACYNSFKVVDVTHTEDRKIATVTIGIMDFENEVARLTFPDGAKPKAAPKTPKSAPTSAPAPVSAPKATATGNFTDDEIILIGNCKGRKYGEVKDTDVFKSFLRWVKNTTTTYPDPEQQSQFERLKTIA